jgi:hypothetical protein
LDRKLEDKTLCTEWQQALPGYHQSALNCFLNVIWFS